MYEIRGKLIEIIKPQVLQTRAEGKLSLVQKYVGQVMVRIGHPQGQGMNIFD